MRCIAAGALTMTLLSSPLLAQVNSRPTDPPIVTAENDSWYRRGEPVIFEGEFYYPAGPDVFFNGNVMFRSGHYNGVPLYADATIEPYSVVLVPVGRNLMRPYERLRSGDLAGTTGSRAPSFPGGSVRASRETPVRGGLAEQLSTANRRNRRLSHGACGGNHRTPGGACGPRHR